MPEAGTELPRCTDGVPLFVEELTKTVLENRELSLPEGVYATTERTEGAIPPP
jgi:predicted ATPase